MGDEGARGWQLHGVPEEMPEKAAAAAEGALDFIMYCLSPPNENRGILWSCIVTITPSNDELAGGVVLVCIVSL